MSDALSCFGGHRGNLIAIGSATFMSQNHGVSEPAALPRHPRQSDREPGEFLRCSL